ncbi:MAG TPA: FkbM family methyltransferase [Stellaceae bacterium]|nr:FkbM family methyltransferase [Stellaceae bacterium]
MRASAKGAIEGLADRLGYLVLPKWRLPNLELSTHLRQLFQKYGIDCVIDVGANTGQYGQFLRNEVGFAGLIISIEPLSDCFVDLNQAASCDPDWIVLNFALGATAGNALFNVMAYRQLSSFLDPSNDQAAHMAALNQVHQKISVPVRRLDTVVATIEACRPLGPIYLKLDTQGFDLEVVKGCGAAIERVQALQTEVSVLPIYDGMTDWRSAIAALETLGFAMSGLWAVNRDFALKAMEFDCVMVRSTGGSPDRTPSGNGREDARD